MKVEELMGSKVWVKSDQFKSVPGVISSVDTSVDREDLKSYGRKHIQGFHEFGRCC
jgi:hypothetical protein